MFFLCYRVVRRRDCSSRWPRRAARHQFACGVNREHAGIVTEMLYAGVIRYCFVSRLEIISAPMLLGWQRREKFLCGE